MINKEKQNNEGDLVDNSSYDERNNRCNSCKWFDKERRICDHCGYGYPYVDYNGLKPNEVSYCEIFTKDNK